MAAVIVVPFSITLCGMQLNEHAIGSSIVTVLLHPLLPTARYEKKSVLSLQPNKYSLVELQTWEPYFCKDPRTLFKFVTENFLQTSSAVPTYFPFFCHKIYLWYSIDFFTLPPKPIPRPLCMCPRLRYTKIVSEHNPMIPCRWFQMVITTSNDAKKLQKQCYHSCTKHWTIIMFSWKEPFWNRTWWLLDYHNLELIHQMSL